LFLDLTAAELAALSFEFNVVVNHIEQNGPAKETLIADELINLEQTLLYDACLLLCSSLGNQTIELNLALTLVSCLEAVFNVDR